MNDTATQQRPAMPQMPVGGEVMAIIPQSFAEIQRIAVQIINAGVAPASLVKYAQASDTAEDIEALGKRNVAAVSTCIMAGAELGLPPMVSLRAFTVINGKPALYADGNVAVVRKAKAPNGTHIAEYLKTGYEEVCDYICPVCNGTFTDEKLAATHFILKHRDEATILMDAGLGMHPQTFERTGRTDRSYAWCEAKRSDNGEIYREQFSIEDAKRAGLWEGDSPTKRAKIWRDKATGTGREQVWVNDAPNDAPWYRYWKRMMMWRSVGYCLRWLFADVLGGMPDEYEAREIEAMIDITPALPPRAESAASSRPTPPPAPAEDDPLHNSDQQIDGKNEGTIISGTATEVTPADQAGDFNDDDSGVTAEPESEVTFVAEGKITPEVRVLLTELRGMLNAATTEAEVEAAFDAFDPQTKFAGNTVAIGEAFGMKESAASSLATKQHADLEAAGQSSMFPGDLPMPKGGK
jgi:hypothetical protein